MKVFMKQMVGTAASLALVFGAGLVFSATVTLSSGSNCTYNGIVADVSGNLKVECVTNQTPAPGVLQFPSATGTSTTAGNQIILTVQRIGGTEGALDAIVTSAATAEVPNYGVSVSKPVHFDAASSIPQQIIFPTVANSTAVGAKSLSFTLTSDSMSATPAVIGSPATATVVISDNNTVGALQFPSSASAGVTAGQSIVLSVQRVGGTAGDFDAVVISTAAADVPNYAASVSKQVHFSNGSTATQQVIFPTFPNSTAVGVKSLTFTLTRDSASATPAQVGFPSATTVAIADNVVVTQPPANCTIGDTPTNASLNLRNRPDKLSGDIRIAYKLNSGTRGPGTTGTGYAGTAKFVAVSTRPCDFAESVPPNCSGGARGNDPMIWTSTVPGGADCQLQPNTDYYHNVKNGRTATDVASCTGSADCSFWFYW